MTNKYIQQLVSLLSHRITMIIILVSLYIVFSQHIPLNIERCMYAISLSIKDVLLLLMPISIFAFISTSIISFQKKATLFVVSIVLFEALSNFTSTWYAYITAMMVNNNVIAVVNQAQHDFTPLFRLGINKSTWWNPSNGSIAGVICGLLIAILETKLNGKKSYLTHCIISGLRYIKGLVFFLKSKAELIFKIMAQLIPIFILGLVVYMNKHNVLSTIATHYSDIIIWLILFIVIYIFLIFFVSANFNLKNALMYYKNLLPAGFIAFSSGCSISTMPWTIKCVEKNLQDPSLAKVVIPTTTNIQQIGDCIVNTFLCALIYKSFYGNYPNIDLWLHFTAVFVIARYATAAVIGGAMFIMIPIYEAYLSFTPEMIALIIAFNIFLDPIVTTANVMANGALCKIFENIWNVLSKKRDTD